VLSTCLAGTNTKNRKHIKQCHGATVSKDHSGQKSLGQITLSLQSTHCKNLNNRERQRQRHGSENLSNNHHVNIIWIPIQTNSKNTE
jgi:hypothetical protein